MELWIVVFCLTASFTMSIDHLQFWSSACYNIAFTLQSCSVFTSAARVVIFETAEEAARAYDEAAVLMSGRNAKTNFPVPRSATGELAPVSAVRGSRGSGGAGAGGGSSSATGGNNLSQILSAKLRKCCKTPSPSLTCLRLDPEKSHIGVWQKRAGARADSSWVMTVELNKDATAAASSSEEPAPSYGAATTPTSDSSWVMTVELNKDAAAAASSSEEPAPCYGAATTPTSTSTSTDSPQAMDDEERIVLQMIEELLGRSSPVDHLHGLLHGEEGSLVIAFI